MFDKDPDAVMQSDTVRMLQQKLDQVQDTLKGIPLHPHRLYAFAAVWMQCVIELSSVLF